MFVRSIVALSVLALASACSTASTSAPQSKTASAAKLAKPAPAATVPGELLVRFHPKAGPAQANAAHAATQGSLIRQFKMPGLQHVRVPVGTEASALAAYRANPAVRYAGPNYVVHTTALPDDPLFGDQFGLDNSGQLGGTPDADINAPEAWDITTGNTSGGVVFVIDTGVDYTHPDLANNMWQNPLEAAGTPGLDDDGNGYVDDIFGIDVVDVDSDPYDDVFHGTHVAGTIGAQGNNTEGVVGVNWSAQIGACRFLSNFGGSVAGAIECLDYVKALKDAYLLDPNEGANVILTNNSWGGGFFDPGLDDTIGFQADSDILFVAAAGNASANLDQSEFNPANSFQPNVVTVSATDRFDQLAFFSNYSTYRSHVGAPGLDILSTFPVNQGSYDTISGTSMAAPHVAGLAALLYANDPTLDFVQLKNLLISSGQQTPGTTATTITGSRIRAYDSVNGGALNCSGQTARKQVRPTTQVIIANAGATVDVHAIDVVCGAANGPTVSVDVNGAGTFVLNDDGFAPDDWAGDGRYAATFTVPAGTSVLTFPWSEVLTIAQIEAYDAPVAIPYAVRAITGTPLGMFDDEVVTVTPSFPVMFGNVGFGALNVSNNGFVSFTESLPFSWVNDPLPTSQATTLIAPHWDDFNAFNGGGDVFVQELGLAPNRELVVEWRSESHFDFGPGQTDTVTVQLIMFESSSDFLVNFVDTTYGVFGYDNGATATVGVQWAAGASQQWSFDTDGAVVSGMTLVFPMAAPSVNPPVVAAPTYAGTPANEGDLIDASTSFTDPDSDGPWLVEWDSYFTGYFTVDASAMVSTTGALTTPVPLRQSNDTFFGFYPDPILAVRITDLDGDRSAPQTVVLTDVSDVASVLAPAMTEPAQVVEGNFFRFVSSFTDPGQDSLWIDLWDFNDDFFADGPFVPRGQPGAVASDYFIWNQQGSTMMHAVVLDRCESIDCFVVENFSNQLDQPYTIVDAQPIVFHDYFYESPTQNEPATVTLFANAFSGALDDPSADPIAGIYQWDFDADGTFDATTFEPFITHAYTDDGSFSPVVRVYDEDSFTDGAVMFPVLVDNVAPTPLAIPNQTATEGYAMVVQAEATDPGDDVITWTLTSGPAGSSVTASGVVIWAPSYAQADLDGVTYTITLLANDGDGGTNSVSFDVTAMWRDDDGDGMADTWEIANGMDPTTNDANGDADGDGVSNIDEFTAANGGEAHPGVADASSPLDGGEVGTEDVTLEVVNALDSDAVGPATYHFELATDEALANVLISATAQEDSGGNAGFTAVVLDEDATDDAANGNNVDLEDNTWYYWHAQAEDDTGRFGPWNETGAFFYNPMNDPPTAASLASPLSGNQVTALSPTLTVGNSSDPDDAVVTYTFAVYSDSALANEVANSGAVTAGSFGSTSWTVDVALSDNTLYYWQVTADDATDTTDSAAGNFFVNLANNEPTAPALVGPVDGSTLSTTSVTVEVDNATDADGNTLVYLFELDTSPTFNTTALQSSQNVAQGVGSTEATFAGLSEDTTYWWRARAFDGFATGDWVMGSFVVNAANAAPNAPLALGPADSQVIDTVTPTLRAQNSSDPEGDAITYVFTVVDEDGATVATSAAIGEGAGGLTSFTVPDETLTKGKTYTWTCVATDAGGAASPASAVATFSVYKKASGGGGGGCSVSGTGSGAGSLAALVAAFAMVIGTRRRRRS